MKIIVATGTPGIPPHLSRFGREEWEWHGEAMGLSAGVQERIDDAERWIPQHSGQEWRTVTQSGAPRSGGGTWRAAGRCGMVGRAGQIFLRTEYRTEVTENRNRKNRNREFRF